MGLLLLAFQLSGNDYSPFWKLSKYGLLAFAIVAALITYKKQKPSKGIFVKGMVIGNKLSIIAAALLAVINLVLYSFYPEYAFSKYGLEPVSFQQTVVISGILFFEVFVFGMILTLAALQYLKEQVRM